MKNKVLKILFLSASPLDAGYRLRLDEEVREIDNALRSTNIGDSYELISRWAVRPNDVQEALLRHRPDILHFSGHGSKTQGILLEDNWGNIKPVTKKALVALLRLFRDNVRVVVLNACYSKRQAEAFTQTIDYTVGLNEVIGDKAAILFSKSFYQALSYGRSVEDAFQLARIQIKLEGIPDSKSPKLLIKNSKVQSTYIGVNVKRDRKELESIKYDLKSIVQRLVAGPASEEDRQTIQKALLNGWLVFETDVRGLDVGKDVQGATIITGDNNQVRVELGEAEYEAVSERIFPRPAGILPPFPPLIFIGREDALLDLKKLLGVTQKTLHKNKLTIVRGWPGVGKTTLVSVIGRDPDVVNFFSQGVLWSSLGQNPEIMSILATWGRALGSDKLLRTHTLKEATTHLASLLREKRILLILDDVWEASHVIPFLEAVGDQCALLITTRGTLIAEELTTFTESIYVLPVFTEENALSLLRVIAPIVIEKYPEECRDLVRDVEYLPIALHVAGRFLKTEMELGRSIPGLLKEIKDGSRLIKESAPQDRAMDANIPTIDALFKKSTDLLNGEIQEYFAYLGVFAPKPATFDLAALKAIWLVADPRPIVRILVQRGLLEAVGSGRFQMHSMLAKHARSLLMG